jgi:HAD superfamily hydrolase (TIGR01509 family)
VSRRLRALIWDVDGTLAETEDEGHRVAFNLAFEEAGLPWHWDRHVYAELLQVAGGKERLLAWWQRTDPERAGCPAALQAIQSLHARKTVHYLRLLRQGAVGLRPGVKRLIGEAQAHGLRQAIATTTTPDNVQCLLDVHLPVAQRRAFEVVGAGDAVARKKPAPDIYLWVLERLGLEPGECLALEDSEAGVTAAREAGLPTLLLRAQYTPVHWQPEVLADLEAASALGEPGWPAKAHLEAGSPRERTWQGVVDVTALLEWWECATPNGAAQMPQHASPRVNSSTAGAGAGIRAGRLAA